MLIHIESIKRKIYKFRKLPPKIEIVKTKTPFGGRILYWDFQLEYWEFATSEVGMFDKMDGTSQYEVIDPGKPWHTRLWRRFFPLKGKEMSHEEI